MATAKAKYVMEDGVPVTWLAALDDLKRAVDFFDRVKAATPQEKNAVGTDQWEWLEKAARRVAKLA